MRSRAGSAAISQWSRSVSPSQSTLGSAAIWHSSGTQSASQSFERVLEMSQRSETPFALQSAYSHSSCVPLPVSRGPPPFLHE